MVNVQCTHPDPYIAAMEMDDKRVNKMVLESAQMICTIKGDTCYRPVHQNNPTTHWCASNFNWLVHWHHALAGEYYYRTGRMHKSFITVGQRYSPGRITTRAFRNGARSSKQFPNGGDIDFTDIGDVHRAYRYYLRSRMMFDKAPVIWTRRAPPWWLDEYNHTDRPMIHGHDVWPRSTDPITFRMDINDKTKERYELLL